MPRQIPQYRGGGGGGRGEGGSDKRSSKVIQSARGKWKKFLDRPGDVKFAQKSHAITLNRYSARFLSLFFFLSSFLPLSLPPPPPPSYPLFFAPVSSTLPFPFCPSNLANGEPATWCIICETRFQRQYNTLFGNCEFEVQQLDTRRKIRDILLSFFSFFFSFPTLIRTG